MEVGVSSLRVTRRDPVFLQHNLFKYNRLQTTNRNESFALGALTAPFPVCYSAPRSGDEAGSTELNGNRQRLWLLPAVAHLR